MATRTAQKAEQTRPLFAPVAPLLQPKSIAIVGASESGGSGWSRAIFHNLKSAGFPATTYLINPRREELWGETVYPDFASLPEPIDHALIIVPARFVNDTLREGTHHGLRAATIYSAGFGEGRKGTGIERGQELKALIRDTGISVCGPNCMGTFSMPDGLMCYPNSRLRDLARGPVGGIFHSGGTLGYWFAQAAVRGLGSSYGVSCGNEFGLDLADYLAFMADDPNTRVIVGMVESIRRPNAFMAASRRAFEAEKPVILVKLGRSELGKEQAKTHTGAIAVDDDVFRAVCERYGITCCESIDEMVDFALAFEHGRYPKGDRVAIVTSSGGAAGLSLDAALAAGNQVAALSDDTTARMVALVPEDVDVYNPMDAGSTLAQDVVRFCELGKLFAADANVDILAVQGRIPLADDPVQAPGPYIELKASTDKPVLAFTRMMQNCDDSYRSFQADAGLPFLQGIPTVTRALRALVCYAACRRRGIAPVPEPHGRKADIEGEGLAETLGRYGLRAPQQAVAASPEEAASAAAEIGFPVALKIVSPDVSHKTEIGGVRLGLDDADAVIREARVMAGHTLTGFLVQEMVDGFEIILGVRDDPQFGPLVLVGLGGVFVELLRDVSLRLAPVDADEARVMLAELRGAKALDGFRGRAPRDVDALADAIAGMSQFYLDHRPWLQEIEINPLLVLAEGDGVRCVDVRPVART
jgi:acetyltransferase